VPIAQIVSGAAGGTDLIDMHRSSHRSPMSHPNASAHAPALRALHDDDGRPAFRARLLTLE
jgi:hypothetical protein